MGTTLNAMQPSLSQVDLDWTFAIHFLAACVIAFAAISCLTLRPIIHFLLFHRNDGS